jgi:predicted RNase H-like nuclease (RuvC/YqgF family)
MSALQKLQEKIEQWRRDHEALKVQNSDLKSQLASVANAQNDQESVIAELRNKVEKCTAQEETIEALQRELEEKDAEIEKIIAQVETLLA